MFTSITAEGNVVAAPVTRTFDDGSAVTRVRIASNSDYVNRDGERVELPTTFLNVRLRGHLAKVGAAWSKGTTVIVTGALRTDAWTDGDGNRREQQYIAAEIAGKSERFTRIDEASIIEVASAADDDATAGNGWADTHVAAPGG